jgi:hypothetical protein
MSRGLGKMERAALAALESGDVLTVHDILHRAGLTGEDEYGPTARHSDYASMLRALRRLAERGLVHCIAPRTRYLHRYSGAGAYAYVLASLYEPLSADEKQQLDASSLDGIRAAMRGGEPPPDPDFAATKGNRPHIERFRRTEHAEVYIVRGSKG